jgi:hypothetical protein
MPQPQLSVVPAPRKVSFQPGSLEPDSKRWYVSSAARKHAGVSDRLKCLQAEAQSDARLGDWTLRIGVPAGQAPGAPGMPQGYTILIETGGAWVVGNDADGLFHALVTLEQMLADATSLPACRIDDWPELTLRGHHDDISRKQISTVEDFKRILRLLARYKINLYTPYMEDVLHLKSHPDIGEGRGKLTPEEVKQIVDEARKCNIRVMPTFSLIGHQENLLQLPNYRHLAAEVFQEPSSLNPANPKVREYLKDAIADVAELFPCEYFHMGFDEVIGVKPDDVLAHANWCADQVLSHRKTPVMWVDMIYNHYGYDAIKRLKPEIIGVNWYYGDVPEAGVPHHDELAGRRKNLWALAGYRSWCRFWPDFAGVMDHVAGWMRTLARTGGKMLAGSTWGDAGYENHRHLTWSLHAALAEAAWSGRAADRGTFHTRYCQTMFGRELDDLEDLLENLHDRLGIDGGKSWYLHRRNPDALVRCTQADPDLLSRAGRDGPVLESALESVARAKRQARRNADLLDPFRVTLRRMRSVARRVELAGRLAGGASPASPKKLTAQVTQELRSTRKAYVETWLAHNKPENIEVSLKVFDDAIEEFGALSGPLTSGAGPDKSDRFECFDLPFDTFHEPIAGIPRGDTIINSVPFRFAPLDKTHVLLEEPGEELTLRFEACSVQDLHLIAALEMPGDHQTLPAVEVRWLLGRRVVYSEKLLAIRHLCDWWAIYGEHLWAGGGFKYVDPLRVRPALRPDPNYGLTHLSGFAGAGTPNCDTIELTLLLSKQLRVFAATLQRPVR